MVKQGDLHEPGDLDEAHGEPAIRVAGRRIAGGMIVNDDDGVGRVNDRRAENFARVGGRFVQRSERDFLHADELQFRIEQDDPERLLVEGAELWTEQGVDALRRVQRLFVELLAGEPRTESERRRELHGLRRPHAFDLGKFFYGAARETPEGAETLQELARDIDRIRPRKPGAQEDGDEFAVGERSRSVGGKLLARAILFGQFLNFQCSHFRLITPIQRRRGERNAQGSTASGSPPTLRPKMRKILLFTAGYGEGHNAAARGLQAAFEHLAPETVDAQYHDLFATTFGAMHTRAQKNYLLLINRAPRIWAAIYTALDRTPLLALTLPFLGPLRRALQELIAREQPIAILSVYPVYAHVLARLYPAGKARPFKLHTVITDSITVNRVWFNAPSDSLIVPNEDTARVLAAAGVPDGLVRTLGFPVQPRFALEKIERPAPGPGVVPRVLYMVNARPDLAPSVVRRLLEIEPLHLTVTTGRNTALSMELESIARSMNRPLELHGWTSEMPTFLRTHHLLIGKAGGATVQETIAARTPMLLTGIVPGQEEGNARLLFDNDCGRLAKTPEALASTIREAFADDAALWRRWEANISRLSRPDAALRIARFVLGEKIGD